MYQTSLCLLFSNRDITYIDMEEIKPAKAFDTMCDLAGFIPINLFIDKKI
ncbi:hypothetical protein ACUMON_001288 [Campylobacter jejuni]